MKPVKASGLIASGKIGIPDQKTIDAMIEAPAVRAAESEVAAATKDEAPATAPQSEGGYGASIDQRAEADSNDAQLIPVAHIRDSVFQVRRPASEEYLAALRDSIKESGVISPIVVRPVPGGFEVVAGHHRLEVFRRLGHDAISAVVRGMSDAEAAKALTSDNFVRQDVSDYERYKHVQMLRQNGFCSSVQDLATVLKCSRAHIYQLDSFDGFPPEAKDFLDAHPGILGADAAYSLREQAVQHPDLLVKALILIRDKELLQSKAAEWIASQLIEQPKKGVPPVRLRQRHEVNIQRPDRDSPIKLVFTEDQAKIQAKGLNIEKLKRLIEDNLQSLVD